MRRIFCLLLIAVMALGLLSGASAISYSDRGRYYLYVTSDTSDIYALSTQTDEDGTTTSVLTSIGTLPAGTPISAGEVVEQNYQKVVYMDQSGATHTVIIRKDVVKSNYVTLNFGGSVGNVRIPRPAAANASFIKDYLNYRGISVSDSDISSALGIYNNQTTAAPIADGQVAEENDTFPSASPESTEQPSSATPAKTSGSKSSKATATPAPAVESVQADSLVSIRYNGQEIPVTLIELGLARSTVEVSGETLTVATDSLVWTTNADNSTRFAVVYAPNSGKASLRKTVKQSSMILKKVTGGTLVRVFDIQSKMTGVYVGDTAGYILNSALKFMEPVSTFTTGHLTYKGSLTNTHRINYYTQAKESSRKIMGVHAGAAVTILGQTGTWSEIDLDGYHGYILSKFVTPDEESEPLSDLSVLGLGPAQDESDEELIEEDVDAVEEEDVEAEEEDESEEEESDAV